MSCAIRTSYLSSNMIGVGIDESQSSIGVCDGNGRGGGGGERGEGGSVNGAEEGRGGDGDRTMAVCEGSEDLQSATLLTLDACTGIDTSDLCDGKFYSEQTGLVGEVAAGTRAEGNDNIVEPDSAFRSRYNLRKRTSRHLDVCDAHNREGTATRKRRRTVKDAVDVTTVLKEEEGVLALLSSEMIDLNCLDTIVSFLM